MAIARTALGLALAIAAAATPASAWTPETRIRIVDEAVRFMPASLRLALERHREDLRRGLLEPMAKEDGPEHRATASGSLDASVATAAASLQESVTKPMPFSDVTYRFGVLAHYVTDAGFPPLASGRAAPRRYDHFATYANKRLGKFPLVFLGHDDPNLATGDFRGFAKSVVADAAREDVHLARAYEAAGWPPDPSAFDDRSIPFAVASLSYSRTVNAVVRAWLEAWRESGGDMGYTPYLTSQTASDK